MSVPARLYKYQPFGAQTLENLKERNLWFSAAARFNDPYDCALTIFKTELGQDDLRAAFDYLASATGERESLSARFMVNGQFTDEFRRVVIGGSKNAIEDRARVQLHERGVACLTATNTDLLMWAHYADGHRGFCLEFDCAWEPFSTARQVRYTNDFPRLSPGPIWMDGGGEQLDALILTKADCWRYEQEWRLFHKVYSHLGDVRHRAQAVEYHISQHLEALGERLQSLGLALS
jgi:hypothetical protein